MPPTLTDDELIAIAGGVGGKFARERPWVDEDDAKQEAYIAVFELYTKFDPIRGVRIGNLKGWLGFWTKKRLIDWSRQQKFLYQGRESEGTVVRREHVEWDDKYSPAHIELGYWFVEELSAYVAPPVFENISQKQRHFTRMRGDNLTKRQIEILQLFADGLTPVEIGAKLFLAPESVKSHTKNIRVQLKATSTLHAVAIGFRRELLV